MFWCDGGDGAEQAGERRLVWGLVCVRACPCGVHLEKPELVAKRR